MDQHRLEEARGLFHKLKEEHGADDDLIIPGYGRFGREPLYVAAYYELSQDHGYAKAECKDLNGYWNSFFDIKEEYRQTFKIEPEAKAICVWETDNGFVRCAISHEYDAKEWAEKIEEEARSHMGEAYDADY